MNKKKNANTLLFQHGFIAGMFAFLLMFPLVILEYHRSNNLLTQVTVILTIFLNILYLFLYIVFMRAFLRLGTLFKNMLLTRTGYILIGIEIFTVLYTILLLFVPAAEKPLIVSLELSALGIAVIFFGIAVTKMAAFGKLAAVTGVVQICTGISYLLTPKWTPFSFIALVLFVIGSILELILLYKAGKIRIR